MSTKGTNDTMVLAEGDGKSSIPANDKQQNQQGGRRRNRQGKNSKAKNEERFLERTGQQALKAFRQGILEKFEMFSNDKESQLATAVQNLQIVSQPKAIPLSISTRGVGFATAIAYERTTTTWNLATIAEIATIHQVYRVHLWLVQLKMYLAQQIQTEMPTVIDASERLVIEDEIREQLQTVSRVPSVIALILDSIGKFAVDGKIFHSVYTAPQYLDGRMISVMVNPGNIRAIIQRVNADQQFQQDFMAHNSIPGLALDVQGQIINADVVWPANANEILSADIRAYKHWITRVESRLPSHAFADITWHGNGHSSCLWSTERLPIRLISQFEVQQVPRRTDRRNVLGVLAQELNLPSSANTTVCSYRGFTLNNIRSDFWSREKTGELSIKLGAGSLVGEVCGIMTRFEMNCSEAVVAAPINILYTIADARR